MPLVPTAGIPERWTDPLLHGVSAIYREILPRLLTFARRFAPREDANDLVHDALLRYMTRVRENALDHNPVEREAAIFGCLKSVSVDHQRKSKRRLRLVDFISGATVAMHRHADAALPVQTAELTTRVNHVLHGMPRRWAETFVLAHDGELGFDVVARILDITPSTARANHARACARLRRELVPLGVDETLLPLHRTAS